MFFYFIKPKLETTCNLNGVPTEVIEYFCKLRLLKPCCVSPIQCEDCVIPTKNQ